MYPIHLENENEKLYTRVFSDFAKRLLRELAPRLKKVFPEERADGATAVRVDEAICDIFDFIESNRDEKMCPDVLQDFTQQLLIKLTLIRCEKRFNSNLAARSDAPDDDIFQFLETLQNESGDWIDSRVLESRIARNFNLLDAWSRDKTMEFMNGLVSRLSTPQPPSVTGRITPTGKSGELWLTMVNLNAGMTKTILGKIVRQNLELIRSLASEHIDEVAGILNAGYTGGQSLKTITDAIEYVTGVNRNRAKFWARDQASKFFGEVTKMRQTAAGIPGYIWRALKDGRVRDAHAEVSGKFFDWKNPPNVGVNDNPVHPGEDFNCRCWAEPAFGPEQEDARTGREDPLAYMNR
ncbi:MAG TPA: minor capsid protein [Spirochaetota bacterium]|nr:minor capsid protein [Spirochaetota bacterium]